MSAEGIEFAPAYDLLSTGSYHARAFADERADWPATHLAILLPDATTFVEVNQNSALSAGEALGLPRRTGERELDQLTRNLPAALSILVERIEPETAGCPEPARAFLVGEARLLTTVQHLIVPEMLERVKA